MYLSRIMLDSTRPKTMLALTSPNLFHGTLESAVPGERTRKLWRLDTLRGEHCLLILSEEKADWSTVCAQFGKAGAVAETKEYDTLLHRITENSKWQFRLRANPTISVKQADKRGKVCAHITTAHQMHWLAERADKHGFSLKPDEYLVKESKWYSFRKNGTHRVRMLSVTYEGMLTVTNAELFRQTLTHGIGREKAYGMGLLTVITPRG